MMFLAAMLVCQLNGVIVLVDVQQVVIYHAKRGSPICVEWYELHAVLGKA